MKHCFRLGAVLLLGASVAPAVIAQGFPKAPPPPGPLVPAPYPPFAQVDLPNGLRILVVQSKKQPIVSLTLAFSAGGVHDPAGKEGLASMVAGLLTKGAGARTAEQVSEAIEGAGGSLSAGAGSDFLAITSTVLKPSLPLAFELMGDAVLRPTFPEAEVELLRTQTLSALQVAATQPDVIADRAFRAALYGRHPYGRSPTPSGVQAISKADLVAFHRARLRPSGALLVLAGDVTLAEARRLAAAAFQGWTGTPPTAAPSPAAPARGKPELVLVHRPGSVQSNIVVGNLSFLPTDPRSYAATVANQVLGGGAASRLFMILREQKIWTYGAYSQFTRRKGLGFFSAGSEVRTEVTDSALTEILHQLRRITTEPVPRAESDAAKGSITGHYPLQTETADQVASAVSDSRLYGLIWNYVQTYRVRIGSVTPVQMRAAAKAFIRPDSAVIVVVGDGAKIYEKLRAIAPITILDPDGKPLTPADLTPKVATLDLDIDALVARRDSFTVTFSGRELGWQRGVLEKTPDGFRYVEDTELPGVVTQTTTLEMDAKGRIKSVKQTGKQMGQDAGVDVVYSGGRAKGSATTIDPQTRKSKAVVVDTVVIEGTIDDNSVQALVPALKWKAGAKWTMTVLSAGQAEIKPWTMSVGAVETITVGGKPREVYRASVTGPDAPLTFWVTTASPHTLVKIGLTGQPLEFNRVP